MSKRVIGSTEIEGKMSINGNDVVTSFNDVNPNPNTGNVDYNILSPEKMQALLDVLPVSRIGSQDTLPIDINVPYQGGTNYSFRYPVQPIVIENDGNATMLRCGTDGQTYDWYYTYIKDIRNVSVLNENSVIHTNEKYVPSFFGDNHKMVRFINSEASEVLMYETINGSVSTYAITLTNGSLNYENHVTVTIDKTAMPAFEPMFVHICSVQFSSPTILIWGRDTSNSGLGLCYYTIPVIFIHAGAAVYPQLNKGFSGSTLTGRYFDSNNNPFILYDTLTAPNGTADTLILRGTGIRSVAVDNSYTTNFYAKEDKVSGNIRFLYYPQFTVVSTDYQEKVSSYAISALLNTINGAVVYDMPSGRPIYTEVVNGEIVIDNSYPCDMMNMVGVDNGIPNTTSSMFYSFDGIQLCTIATYGNEDLFKISKSNIQNFTSIHEALNITSRTLENQKLGLIDSKYKSPIGTDLRGFRMLPDNNFLIAAKGTNNGESTSPYTLIKSDFDSQSSYTYKSISTNGVYNGYAPSSNRTVISNDNMEFTALISIMDSSTFSTRTFGSSFIEGLKNTAFGELDVNTMTFSDTFTIQDSVLKQAGQDAYNLVSTGNTVNDMKSTYYHLDPSDGISVLVTVVNYTNVNRANIVISNCTSILTTSEITSIDIIGTPIIIDVGGPISPTIKVDEQSSSIMCGMSINKTTYGFDVVCVDSLHLLQYQTFDIYPSSIAKFIGNSFVSGRTDFTYTEMNILFTLVPSRQNYVSMYDGFGFQNYTYTMNDASTKLLMSKYGGTEAQLDSYINSGSGTVTYQVLCAQQVPGDEFVVDIREELPVFLAGVYYKLPSQKIDLHTVKADPSNSTFYVYIEMDRLTKTAKYKIMTGLYAESIQTVYIGTITTDATSITNIDVQKVSRYLSYRANPVKHGSSIPVSIGVPTQPGTRWH